MHAVSAILACMCATDAHDSFPACCQALQCICIIYIGELASFHALQVTLVLKALQNAGIRQPEISDWMHDWTWPSWATGASTVFEKKIDLAKDKFKCSAQEGLATYPVFLEFLTSLESTRVTPEVQAAAECFSQLAKVLDSLCQLRDPAALEGCILQHLELFKETYGASQMPPKAHYAAHLPLHIRHQGLLLSCFVHERRHRLVKRYGDAMCTGVRGVEKSILEETCLTHLQTLEHWKPKTLHLMNPKPAPDHVARDFAASTGLRYGHLFWSKKVVLQGSSRQVASGDVVFMGTPAASSRETAMKVLFHVDHAGAVYTCGKLWAPMESTGKHWRASEEAPFWVPACCINCVCIVRILNDNLATLLPVRR